MSWEIQYLPEALDDLRRLDGSQRIQVLKAIKKVSEKPFARHRGRLWKTIRQPQPYQSLRLSEDQAEGSWPAGGLPAGAP